MLRIQHNPGKKILINYYYYDYCGELLRSEFVLLCGQKCFGGRRVLYSWMDVEMSFGLCDLVLFVHSIIYWPLMVSRVLLCWPSAWISSNGLNYYISQIKQNGKTIRNTSQLTLQHKDRKTVCSQFTFGKRDRIGLCWLNYFWFSILFRFIRTIEILMKNRTNNPIGRSNFSIKCIYGYSARNRPSRDTLTDFICAGETLKRRPPALLSSEQRLRNVWSGTRNTRIGQTFSSCDVCVWMWRTNVHDNNNNNNKSVPTDDDVRWQNAHPTHTPEPKQFQSSNTPNGSSGRRCAHFILHRCWQTHCRTYRRCIAHKMYNILHTVK